MSSKPGESAPALTEAVTNGTVEATVLAEKQPAPEAETPPPEKKEEPVTEEKKAEEPAAAPTPAEERVTTEEKKVEEATAAVAAAPVPASEPALDNTTSGAPVWPETSPEHPLTKFFESFEELTKKADHNEVFGIVLSKDSPFHTKLILQKFLRANANDLTKAKEQLLETLEWRKSFEPNKAAEESFDKERFEGLGYILELESVPDSANKKEICTFNIYGAVTDNEKTFGDIDGFLRWRVGLMERSIHKLDLANATRPIPDYGEGPDPYQGFQVHDYLQVSFIRRDPLVKAATKVTIEILGRYYPETLSRKFFVNVPVIMGWVFQAVKLFVAKETIKKFTVFSYGNQLAAELGEGVPKAYGGAAGELKEVGEGMKLKE